jgi:hypothetical protein
VDSLLPPRRSQRVEERVGDRGEESPVSDEPRMLGGAPCDRWSQPTETKSARPLTCQMSLIDAIDRRLYVLKIHVPYHESHQVLNIAQNTLYDGAFLQDLELRRHDKVFLDTLGARRIPKPTTGGDSCVGLTRAHIQTVQNLSRISVSTSGPSNRPTLLAGADRHGRWARGHHRPVRARDAHRLRRPLSLSPDVLSFANTDEVGPEPCHLARQPPVARGRSRAGRPRPRRLPAPRLPPHRAPRRHRLLPDRAPQPPGRGSASAWSSAMWPHPI